MIEKKIKQYRFYKIRHIILKNTIFFTYAYMILLILSVCSEIIFYHSELVRQKIYLLLLAAPILFTIYSIIKILINLKSFYSNMSDELMAKELGNNIPNLSDKILNALQLSKLQIKNETQKGLIEIALKRVQEDIKKIDLKSITPKIPNYKIILPIITFAILTLSLSFERTLNHSLYRIYMFEQTFDPPKPFTIQLGSKKLLSNGNKYSSLLNQNQCPQGEDMAISFIIDKEMSDQITLHFEIENTTDKKSIKLTPIQTVSGTYYNHIFNNITSPVEYYATFESNSFFSAWDTIKSDIGRIEIIKMPEIESIELKVTYPEYSNLEPVMYDEKISNLKMLSQSKINYKIKSDQSLDSLYIISDNQDTVSLIKSMDGFWETSVIMNESQTHMIYLKNEYDFYNNRTYKYNIKVFEDTPPDLFVLSPKDGSFEITENSVIPIKFEMYDDYGIEKSWIEYSITTPDYINLDSTEYSNTINTYLNTKRYSESYNWDLLEYNLFPGDQIKFCIVSKDNNPNANGVTKSKYYIASYPSFEDIFNSLENSEQEIEDLANDVKTQIEDMDNTLEDIKLDLLKASNIDVETQAQSEKSIQEMKDIFDEIQNMEDAINELKEQAEKDNIVDNELINKFGQFQELLNSMMTPELLEALEKMQEALDNMNLEDMLEAVENFDYNLDQFEQQLDRFIEMFELAIAEQKIDELVEKLKLMSERQKDIEAELKNNANLSELSSMQNRQNQKFDDFQDTMQEAQKSVQKFSKKASDSIKELMESELNSNTEKSLASSKNKLDDNDQSAINNIQESKRNLNAMLEQANDIKELFKEESTKEMIELFYSAIDNILKLSYNQENLILASSNTRFSSPKIKDHTFNQFIINKQFIKFIEQLMILSTKTFHITPDINTKVGFCKKTIDNTIINLEQRKLSTAKREQKNILASMNEIALLLISSMDEIQNTGSASGLSSYLEELEQISQGQSELNMGTMQLGQMGMMSQGDMMQKLQSQQQALQKKLQEILDNMPGENHGGLSKASDDMLDVIQNFENNRVTKETINKQNKILSRLLDSQKSLKEKEYSDKREGTPASDIKQLEAVDNPDNLGQKNLLLIEALEDALNQNYSEEYKRMLREYYKKLLDDEN